MWPETLVGQNKRVALARTDEKKGFNLPPDALFNRLLLGGSVILPGSGVLPDTSFLLVHY